MVRRTQAKLIAKWEEVCGVPFSEVEAFIAHREAMGGATDDDVIEKLKEQQGTIAHLETELAQAHEATATAQHALEEAANKPAPAVDHSVVATLEAENRILQQRLAEALAGNGKPPPTPATPASEPVAAEEFNALAQALEQSNEENERLGAELEASQEIADAASEELGTLSAVIETLQEEKRALEAEKERAQNDLAAVLAGGKPSSAPLPEPPLLATQQIPHSPEESP